MSQSHKQEHDHHDEHHDDSHEHNGGHSHDDHGGGHSDHHADAHDKHAHTKGGHSDHKGHGHDHHEEEPLDPIEPAGIVNDLSFDLEPTIDLTDFFPFSAITTIQDASGKLLNDL